MPTVADVRQFMESLAPLDLAESWDNVGLLFGHEHVEVTTVLTCLTLTPDVAEEAIETGTQLVISHHPVLFRPVQRLTSETIEGEMLLRLAAASVAVYSPHTSFDSAIDGINQQLAELFELSAIQPLRPFESSSAGARRVPDTDHVDRRLTTGSGRCGDLPAPTTLGRFVDSVRDRLHVAHIAFVGEGDSAILRVGIACGSAAESMCDAIESGCHVLLTGEARFHACLEARSRGIAMVLAGHYATERPGIEALAERLSNRFPEIDSVASRVESDPIHWP